MVQKRTGNNEGVDRSNRNDRSRKFRQSQRPVGFPVESREIRDVGGSDPGDGASRRRSSRRENFITKAREINFSTVSSPPGATTAVDQCHY